MLLYPSIVNEIHQSSGGRDEDVTAAIDIIHLVADARAPVRHARAANRATRELSRFQINLERKATFANQLERDMIPMPT